MGVGTNKKKLQMYASGVTVEIVSLTIFNVVLSAFVGASGWLMNTWWPGLHRGDPFILVSVGIVLLLIFAVIGRIGHTITFTDSALIYRRSGRPDVYIFYSEMCIFLAPKTARKWFRTAWVGDHEHLVEVDSEAFRDYDLIVNLIDVARRRRRLQPGRI